MAVSGPPPGGQLGPPEPLLDGIDALGSRIASASARLGREVRWDWPALLGERAALDGLGAAGRTSCGGATRLVRCADGWVAVSLARPTDRDLLPAWLALAGCTASPGALERDVGVEEAIAGCDGARLASAAEVVGLPVGVLGERAADGSGGVALEHFGAARPIGRLRVLDLSSLWAGPLCGSVLAALGAEVTKVESSARPDAGRRGSPGLDRLLNGHKARLSIDLGAPRGRSALVHLIRAADIVVESSRPRALEQLGIVAAEHLAEPGGPAVWVRITAHGPASARVGFGDDAAVAGGLVVEDAEGPWFCGDAIADPLSGLAAAAAALEAVVAAQRTLVDVALAGVAAAHAGPTLPIGDRPVAVPRARGGT